MIFYLLRHGQTDWNKSMIIQGQVDNPLNELGRKQALESAEYLKSETFDFIFSSSMSRAYDTAQAVATSTHYTKDIIIDDHFIERDFGSVCGKAIEGNYERVMQGLVDDMETEEEIVRRVSIGLKAIENTYTAKKVLISCHSHVIKAALMYADSSQYSFRTKLANASTTIIEVKNNEFKVLDMNLCSHLSEF